MKLGQADINVFSIDSIDWFGQSRLDCKTGAYCTTGTSRCIVGNLANACTHGSGWSLDAIVIMIPRSIAKVWKVDYTELKRGLSWFILPASQSGSGSGVRWI